MRREELVLGLIELSEIFPKKLNDAINSAYYRSLRMFSSDQWRFAVNEVIANDERFPVPAKLARYAANFTALPGNAQPCGRCGQGERTFALLCAPCYYEARDLDEYQWNPYDTRTIREARGS